MLFLKKNSTQYAMGVRKTTTEINSVLKALQMISRPVDDFWLLQNLF